MPADNNNSDNNNSVTKRTIIQQQQQQQRITTATTAAATTTKRRKLDNTTNTTSSSGSSDSSSEDEEEYNNNNNISNISGGIMNNNVNNNNIITMPEGWRVKLYRLNQDGSWDDCGTGRITCHYKQPNNNNNTNQSNNENENNNKRTMESSSNNNNNNNNADDRSPNHDDNNNNKSNNDDNNNNNNNNTSNTNDHTNTDNNRTTNKSNTNNNNTNNWFNPEATLCVQAEVNKTNTTPRVLLRTRILLTDAYQRQGDNIITWCEPCYYSDNSNQQSSSDSNNANTGICETGVDLALSFQDNEGCLDIWRQITQVQSRAAHAAALSQSRNQHPQCVEDLAAQTAAQHHADIQQRNTFQSWELQMENASNNAGNRNHNNNDNHHSLNGLGNHMNEYPDSLNNQQQHNQLSQQQQQQLQQPTLELSEQLPNPPTLQNLEDIADTIAALQHVQQREALAAWITTSNTANANNNTNNTTNTNHDQHNNNQIHNNNNHHHHHNDNNNNNNGECQYLKQLLALFPAAEARGDYSKLATLAACVKTILLLNDPSILELIVSVASIFEEVCSCLEYDPDLREKANHRWFLRERAKFRTVVPMDDSDLVEAIHRSFRVNYLRDTLLRPTMDESSLSTLSSLQTFTHADVIKGVTMSGGKDASLKDSYLVRVIRMLGIELHTLLHIDWIELETTNNVDNTNTTNVGVGSSNTALHNNNNNPHHNNAGGVVAPSSVASSTTSSRIVPEIQPDPSIVVVSKHEPTGTWKQYLAPQDYSVSARRLRRRGCLSFLRELFNMVRLSLQQCDKDDFFSVICTLEVDLHEDREISDNISQTSQTVEVGSVASTVRSDRLDVPEEKFHTTDMLPQTANLLSLLGNILSDPVADTTEKGSVLEILSGVAMHDPSLIRRHCLESHRLWKRERQSVVGDLVLTGRPEPNEWKQVIFLAPPNDLLSALIFLLDAETDAGILLQVSEIMRIILDTDVMGDHGPMSPNAFADEAEGIPPSSGQNHPPHDQHNEPSGSGATSTDQKRFLTMFYDHYVEWLVAPFQFTILHPARRIPDSVLRAPSESNTVQRFLKIFQQGIINNNNCSNELLRIVTPCAIRTSFAVELLSFCVRAHLYRMKLFLLKSRALGYVMKLLRPVQQGGGGSGSGGAISGDRCLKLAALRLLRAILSVNDEFYHRHIIQHNLFAPVFEAFRANPVGDNLVSSAIVEMCDYIHTENIKSLLEYIVTKHLSTNQPERGGGPSLEDVSSPYVSTLTTLRKAYEANIEAAQRKQETEKEQSSASSSTAAADGSTRYFPGTLHHHQQQQQQRRLSGKALEDQRKFREVDEEQSYFDMDDDDDNDGTTTSPSGVPPVVDEVEAQESNNNNNTVELHRTPRMFSLAQAPLLNNLEERDSNNNKQEQRNSSSSSNSPGQQHSDINDPNDDNVVINNNQNNVDETRF